MNLTIYMFLYGVTRMYLEVFGGRLIPIIVSRIIIFSLLSLVFFNIYFHTRSNLEINGKKGRKKLYNLKEDRRKKERDRLMVFLFFIFIYLFFFFPVIFPV